MPILIIPGIHQGDVLDRCIPGTQRRLSVIDCYNDIVSDIIKTENGVA